MKTIHAYWKEIEHLSCPKDATEAQRRDVRRAFYAGFTASLNAHERVLADDISVDHAAAMLEALHDEAASFSLLVGAGQA